MIPTETQTRIYLANIKESTKDAIICKLVCASKDGEFNATSQADIEFLQKQILEFIDKYGAWTQHDD